MAGFHLKVGGNQPKEVLAGTWFDYRGEASCGSRSSNRNITVVKVLYCTERLLCFHDLSEHKGQKHGNQSAAGVTSRLEILLLLSEVRRLPRTHRPLIQPDGVAWAGG